MERWTGLTPAEKPPIDREIELNLFEREKNTRATLPATQPVGQRSNSNPNWSAFKFQPRLSDSIRARV